MPMYPPGYHHYNLSGIKLVKQADVVMLTYVLPDEFPMTSSAPTTTTMSR
jgi:trehalose/maltose hydrolase-like predicted phosphorylase